VLLAIGLSAVKFSSKPNLAERFSKAAGFLVIFFALFNISNQMNVLGFVGADVGQTQTQTQKTNQNDLPAIVNGQQVIKMTASGSKDTPNYFKVKVGVPVRWEITGTNSLGCNGAIISSKLFSDIISLTPGGTVIKEFTPQSAGKFGFSCTMGMVRGTIEVVN
jgi:plastocyanin domain-containing protein